MSAKSAYHELEQEVVKLWQREELLQKTEKSRHIAENLNEAIYMMDLNARVTYVSPNIERLSGYSAEEIIDSTFTEFVYPFDVADWMECFLEALFGKKVTMQFRFLTRNGETMRVTSTPRPIFKGNKVVGLQGILVDITERKKTEKEKENLLGG